MAESSPPRSSSLADNGSGLEAAAPKAGHKRSLWRRAMGYVGGRVVSVALYSLDKLLAPPRSDAPPDAPAEAVEGAEPNGNGGLSAAGNPRLRVLHSMAEQVRGAADSFLAAKLDEIEARVDAKLDDVERRLDQKIVEMHRHLAEMRDKELQHRLRILKVTLIFTVLVALLSVGYKLLSKHWFHA